MVAVIGIGFKKMPHPPHEKFENGKVNVNTKLVKTRAVHVSQVKCKILAASSEVFVMPAFGGHPVSGLCNGVLSQTLPLPLDGLVGNLLALKRSFCHWITFPIRQTV